MAKTFDVVFSRTRPEVVVLRVEASSLDEAKQKGWEAVLVDEQKQHLLWQTPSEEFNVTLDAAGVTDIF